MHTNNIKNANKILLIESEKIIFLIIPEKVNYIALMKQICKFFILYIIYIKYKYKIFKYIK